MQPTLAWLDFNTAERERTQRVLALFEERDTRDELGLGGIRDSFADHSFPGTSTIQTRLDPPPADPRFAHPSIAEVTKPL